MDPRILRSLAEDWPAPYVYRILPVATPAVNTDFTLTVPGESTFGLIALTAQLVTDGNAANRSPILTVTDGSVSLWSIEAGAVQTATTTVVYSWLPEYPAFPTTIVGGTLVVPMPPTYLAPGMTLTLTTANRQVGDQWSAIRATVLECFTGHVERERSLEDAILDRAEAIAAVIEGTI